MALTGGAARRYAEAAFEIAGRDDTLDVWLAAFDIAEERLSSPQIQRLLANPAIPAAARIEILDRILDADVSGAPHSLLALLVRRGRFEMLPAVKREFTRLHQRREGIVEAIVTTAAPLAEAELEALRERLTAVTGSRVFIQQLVDPDLIGGLQVRLGDTLIDGSVRGRLERLRISFVHAAI